MAITPPSGNANNYNQDPGLISENNTQYYRGYQDFEGNGVTLSFTANFNTDLVFYTPSGANYALNNFKLYTGTNGNPRNTYVEVLSGYSVSGNKVTFDVAPSSTEVIVVQLKRADGGDFGTNPSVQGAVGNAVEENYGSYAYTKLQDVINNFIVGYVGTGKLIPSVKRTDVVFHAKRGLQEFSYDTLKSIKSQELTIPNSLSIVIPQDYVKYVKMSWISDDGVKHIIYPTTLTSNPGASLLQSTNGIPEQDQFDNNITASSSTEKKWKNNDLKNISSLETSNILDELGYGNQNERAYGQLYGIDPQHANFNGWFTINEREGKISFSANLVDKLVIFEYVSDGLAYDMDTKLPKMAEEAMYAHISYSILAGRANQPEYVVRRLKQDRSAKLRNAKIRLSNIKLSEITQVMRGKSKQIKH